MSDPSMQIWNNAVFDDGSCSAGGSAAKRSPAWCAFRPLSAIPPPAEPFTLAAGKENRSPGFAFLAGGALPLSAAIPPDQSTIGVGGTGAGRSIEEEIEEVEKEIERLQARLQELRLKKTERDSRSASRRGRIVPSKFLDLKPSPAKKSEVVGSPAGGGYRRRSASLGPLEICAATIGLRRGEEVPPPPSLTPLRSAQSKRKSCFQKLQDIAEDEGEVEKKIPCGSIAKDPALTMANSPAGPTNEEFSRKGVSLGPSVISAASSALRREEIKEARCLGRGGGGRRKEIQPKMLFHETKKPFKREAAAAAAPPPPPLREPRKSAPPPKRASETPKVRTVSSRYSLITVKVGRNPPEGKRRKWSLPTAAAAAVDKFMPWEGPEMIDEEVALTEVNAEGSGRAGMIGQPAGRRNNFPRASSALSEEEDLMDLEEDDEQQ
ncbi:unnamed protein product [Spirodela intermedia]|uniref:Uncharacterized protein n=1 Tax=Spirodela intermedia TaxID=51605 RepID=A0A7I8KCF5_SPIIN|nr:unnamed protein product [Spirodela intermedia]